MEPFKVGQLKQKNLTVTVPASKSILSRALLLAAFTEGDTRLICGKYGDDTLALLGCLNALGIAVEACEDGLLVHGRRDFSRKATLNVGSAGTAARFLPAILAFFGGEYDFSASEQMSGRPMEILSLLSALGVGIDYARESGHFPFRMRSNGVAAGKAEIGTDVSTQYASGLMLAAALSGKAFDVALTGSRTDGSYLAMTAALIRAFGGECSPLGVGKSFRVTPIVGSVGEFAVEPDLSGACYFYALSLLCNAAVTVRGVHFSTLQGDVRFLQLLRDKGVRLTDRAEGVLADGRTIPFYNGIDEEMKDFSDQTMTVAVLAAFADSPSILRGVSHIRSQECDRVNAILQNLNALGVRAFTNGDDIFIEPAPVRPCRIETFGDHRMAMAFSLVGLKIGGVTIDDAACCRKTFPNFFEIVEELTK